MDFDLPDDHRLLRDTVREFADQEIAPVAEELDRTKSFPYDIVRQLGELDLMGIPFPEEYGGAGGDSLAYALAVEELTRVDSSVAITLCAHTSLGTQPIYLFGSEEQKQEWMPRLCAGELLGAFGLTEPEAGSDAGNTQTRAVLDDGEWVINGSKQFITNAGTSISGLVVITAVTGEPDARARPDPARPEAERAASPSIRSPTCSCPTARPATSKASRIGRWAGTRPTRGRCRSTTAACPRRTWSASAARGLKQFLHVLDIGRIGVAAMGVGLAQGAFDEALAYARERRAFGQPISKLPVDPGQAGRPVGRDRGHAPARLQGRVSEGRGTQLHLDRRPGEAESGRLAVRAADEAVQIHGGYGYIEEYPVCRFYRDAKILTIGEGTDEVQQMVIARQLGA